MTPIECLVVALLVAGVIIFVIVLVAIRIARVDKEKKKLCYGGVEDPLESNRILVKETIDAAKESIIIVSCTALDNHWTSEIAGWLESAIREKGIKVTFIVGYDEFSATSKEERNLPILDLARRGVIELRFLKEKPPADMRLVDDGDSLTYCTPHLEPEDNNKRVFVMTKGHEFGITSFINNRREKVHQLLNQSVLSPEEL